MSFIPPLKNSYTKQPDQKQPLPQKKPETYASQWSKLVQSTLEDVALHQDLQDLESLEFLNATELKQLQGIHTEITNSKLLTFLNVSNKVCKLASAFFLGEAALTGILAFIANLIPNSLVLSTAAGSFFRAFTLDYAIAGVACKVGSYVLGKLEENHKSRIIAGHIKDPNIFKRIKKMSVLISRLDNINGFIEKNKEFLISEKFAKIKDVKEALTRLDFLKTKASRITESHIKAIESNLTPELFSIIKA